MLFLLKRTWQGGLAGLAVLTLLGLGLRFLVGTGAPVQFSATSALLGIGAVSVMLASDALWHGIFSLVLGEPYRRRHRELAAVFRGQTFPAILAGAAMAGLGEELVFRGASTDPIYLTAAAIAFGLLHHIRRSFWLFTLWSIYQGLLLALALYFTQALAVTMVGHFLHDLMGFLLFRYLNRTGPDKTPS